MAGFGAALAVTIAACVVEPRRGADSRPGTEVHWAGEQRRAVQGDVAAKVRLTDLGDAQGLCAVGPLEGMRGEITVAGGRVAISRVHAGSVQVDEDRDVGAAFLVWIEAPAWRVVELPADVGDEASLGSFLPRALAAAGLDPSRPAAFRIDGDAESLAFHVLDMPDGSPASPEAHERAKRRFALRGAGVRLVGFRSSGHRGVFTPPGSDLHVHFVSEDRRSSGHVESFILAPGATLRVAGHPAERP